MNGQNERKNHQQNPVSETSVSSIAAVYSLDAVWLQQIAQRLGFERNQVETGTPGWRKRMHF
jgi:hypothetical protein